MNFLREAVKRYEGKVYGLVMQLFKGDCLFKLLNSSNKLISVTIDELFKAIIEHCPHEKMYPILANEITNKNVHVR
jgi:hypothetical protein